MIKTIIFDFGNVVGFFDYWRGLRKLAPFASLSSPEMLNDIYLGCLEDPYECGLLTTEEFIKAFRTLCPLSCDDEFLSNTVADIFWPNPEICDLIPRLKSHYRLLLGSNTNAIHADKFLGQFANVLKNFHGLVLSFQIGVRKPKPGFFKHCVQLADCSSEECLFVDDLPTNVEGALRCGLQGVVYTPNNNFIDHLHSFGIEFSGNSEKG